jgi:two-component system, NarL family, nitrate/nitrite response regulator NarL
MKNVIPVIVTHPCTIFRDGIRQTLVNTRFRPVRTTSELCETSERDFVSSEISVWLIGLENCDGRTTGLISHVLTKAPRVKPVVLASAETSYDEVVSALKAGVCGFLCENISCESLVKSLELIVLGETVLHGGFLQSSWPDVAGPITASMNQQVQGLVSAMPPSTIENGCSNASSDREIERALSKREMRILRTLMEGISNKTIARQLVITESTVKVHIKAILRKLRLHNRTQAAMWARDHLAIDLFEPRNQNPN